MAIKGEEMNALRLLLKEELEIALQPLREELNMRFDKIGSQIDGFISVTKEESRNTYPSASRLDALSPRQLR